MWPAEAQEPNIILIMTDDLGWGDVGFNGNEDVVTPHLDDLAAQGTIFDRFYSASPVCSPTRASVLTGRNPLRINIPHANQGHIKHEEVTLPEILQRVGYSTGHFGKWHLGTLTRSTLDGNRGGRDQYIQEYSLPSMHGYDEYFCTESKVPTYDPLVFPAEFRARESLRFGWQPANIDQPAKPYGTAYWVGEEERDSTNLEGDDSRIIMDRVIPFIERAVEKNQSFFTTIWFHTPHLPVVADSIHRNYYRSMDWEQQIYFGTITALDEQIGRLWGKLAELNIEEKTIIWFCSDNGPEIDTPGRSGPFRERKRSLYEGGVRVPAFITWKNQIRKGIRMDFPAVTSDYLPSILEILDIDYPDDRPIDGESLISLLSGAQSAREKPIGFLFDKNEKMSWVNNRYKLISTDGGISFQLYDLINDMSEKENILPTTKGIGTQMKNELLGWINSVENSKRGLDYD